MASKAQSFTTTDHDQIRQWAEARDAQPACVKGTGDEGDIGILRLDFPGFSGEESLQHISWDDWFGKFDERGLALLYQEETAGGAQSNFNKIVSRETAAANDKRSSAKKGSKRGAKKVAAKKSPAKKTAKKPPAKKTTAKKAAKKVPPKKAAKKAPAKKASKKTAKKASKRR